jgi:integrase
VAGSLIVTESRRVLSGLRVRLPFQDKPQPAAVQRESPGVGQDKRRDRAHGEGEVAPTETHVRSHLAMRGATAIEIKDLAGHQSIATTNRYMHLAPERRRTAMALLETGRGESVARSS